MSGVLLLLFVLLSDGRHTGYMPMRTILRLVIGREGKYNMHQIIIHPDVLRTIQSETARFQNSECAGLLLGVKKNDGELINIVKSHGDGPRSQRTSGSVSPDVYFFNELIRKAEKENLEFIGEWHRHPGNFQMLSQGDIVAIEKIMEVNGLKNYVAIIVTRSGESIEIIPYIFRMVPTYEKATYEVRSLDLTPKTTYTKPMSGDVEPEAEIKAVSVKAEQPAAEEYATLPALFSQALEKVRCWLRGGIKEEKNLSSSSRKGVNTPPNVLIWYETDEGKRRLLFEKKLMNQHFPNFSLLKKRTLLLWSGVYKGHKIALTYPETYPTKPIRIELSPVLRPLPDEKDCLYAVLAAQTAYLRIESATEPPSYLERT